MTKVLRGRIRDGKVAWDSIPEVQEIVTALEGQRVEITIRPAPRKPSVAQHRFYRGVVLPLIGEHIGCAVGETHRALKRELLPVNPEALNPKVRSTAHLSREEFSEYLTQVAVLASEMGVVLPQPGEVEP